MLKEFEDKKAEQTRLQNEREAEQRRNAEQAARSQREFEEQQRMQEERDRQAQEDLARQQAMQQQQMQQQQYSGRQMELERDILAMRGQYERDQMMLEQYDRVRQSRILSAFADVLRRLYRESKLSKRSLLASATISKLS